MSILLFQHRPLPGGTSSPSIHILHKFTDAKISSLEQSSDCLLCHASNVNSQADGRDYFKEGEARGPLHRQLSISQVNAAVYLSVFCLQPMEMLGLLDMCNK